MRHQLALLVWIAASTPPAGAQASAPGNARPPLAFVGVHVIRSDRAELMRDQTVVVEGDRIAWIGESRSAKLAPGTRRISARGKYLLAGFADMHVHIGGARDLVTYVANGITTVRNMSGLPPHLAWRDSTRSGALLGPRIVTAGAILDGDPPSVPDMTVLTDARQARAEVFRQADAGYDFIKVYNSLPAAVYDSVIVAARDRQLAVAGHVPFAAGLSGALRSGQRSIEHLRGYIAELVPTDAKVQPGASLSSRSVAWNYVDTTRYARLVEATVRAGVWNCPTLMVTAELLAPPERWAALSRRPILRYLGPGASGDRAQVPYLKSFSDADYRDAQRGVAPQRQLVRALHAAGGGILAGTDSYLQGFALQSELEQLAASGLSAWDVLMIATRDAARYLGEERDWGAVATGQLADLQLVDANPLVSVQALRRRAGVMVRGRWYPRAELNARLERIAASYRTSTPTR